MIDVAVFIDSFLLKMHAHQNRTVGASENTTASAPHWAQSASEPCVSRYRIPIATGTITYAKDDASVMLALFLYAGVKTERGNVFFRVARFCNSVNSCLGVNSIKTFCLQSACNCCFKGQLMQPLQPFIIHPRGPCIISSPSKVFIEKMSSNCCYILCVSQH